MNLDELKRAVVDARKIQASYNGASFDLLLPTDYLWRSTLERHRDERGDLLEAEAFREILGRSLVGWQGVKCSDVLGGSSEDLLPYSPEARELLLDARMDVADVLTIAIGNELKARRQKRGEALKN